MANDAPALAPWLLQESQELLSTRLQDRQSSASSTLFQRRILLPHCWQPELQDRQHLQNAQYVTHSTGRLTSAAPASAPCSASRAAAAARKSEAMGLQRM